MNLLLDSHSFLWFIEGGPQLSPRARSLIADPANVLFLSMASVWEIAIKVSLGKLQVNLPITASTCLTYRFLTRWKSPSFRSITATRLIDLSLLRVS